MNNVNRLALAAAAAAALGAAATPSAYAGSNLQGPRLTGIALETLEAGELVVTAVRLPSGDDGTFPNGVGPDGFDPERGSDRGGIMVAVKPDPNPTPR
jgi:hypothetical protein